MIQLWLGGNRIDGIPMLRALFNQYDNQEKEKLCAELLKKIKAGIFAKWLEEYPETLQGKTAYERQQDKLVGILSLDEYSSRIITMSEGTSLSEEILNALATICGIDALFFKNASVDDIWEFSNSPLEIVKNQEWFKHNISLQRTLKSVEPDKIVFDTNSFHQTLSKLPLQDQGTVVSIYLANVGKQFTLPNRDIYNLRLVGMGQPIVRFPSCFRGRIIDLDTQNLYLKDLNLNHEGVNLEHLEGRIDNVTERK